VCERAKPVVLYEAIGVDGELPSWFPASRRSVKLLSCFPPSSRGRLRDRVTVVLVVLISRGAGGAAGGSTASA
jgi:hypothetical protein